LYSKLWCGRRDLNPHGPFKPCGFSYRLRLSPPRGEALAELTPGLRSGLSLHPPPKLRSLGAAHLVSTPSRLVSSGLGSGLPFQGSPNLSSSASPVSQASTQVFLKSAAYAIPPRPRAAVLLMIGHAARFYTSGRNPWHRKRPRLQRRGLLHLYFLSTHIIANGSSSHSRPAYRALSLSCPRTSALHPDGRCHMCCRWRHPGTRTCHRTSRSCR
jgi:hypothetical protein